MLAAINHPTAGRLLGRLAVGGALRMRWLRRNLRKRGGMPLLGMRLLEDGRGLRDDLALVVHELEQVGLPALETLAFGD